jgi:GMP synthase (glutamine-hydrolysing)
VVGLFSDESSNWTDKIFLAKLIPRILHNVNRVCYIFGGSVVFPITDITHTLLSKYVLSQVRQADDIVNQV